MFKNILIPTDGSEHSEKVATDGVELAKALNAKIVAVHVIQFPYVAAGGEPGAISPNLVVEVHEALRADGNRYLDRIRALAEAAGVPFERVLLEDRPPWKGILEAAEKYRCDMIMMAAHGHRGIIALVLGSETYKVLTHSKIPVLVYR